MAIKDKKRGKAAAAEFTEQMLPHNRKQQFFDCIKMRYVLFGGIGAVLLLFLLPWIVSGIYRDFTFIGFEAKLSGGEISRDEYFAMRSSVSMVVSIINIPCITFASVGFAGSARVIRQLVWGEGVFFKDDFIQGIKSNGLSYAVIFFFGGALSCINEIVSSFLYPVEILKYVPYAITVVFLLPLALYLLSQAVVYKNGLMQSLKNSGVLYVRYAPYTLVFLLILISPAFMGFIPLVFVKYLLYVLLILFALPPFLLAWLLFCFSIFDKHINSRLYPQLYMRGLYKPDPETEN